MTYQQAVSVALLELAEAPEGVALGLLLHRIGELIGDPPDSDTVQAWVKGEAVA